MELIIHHGRGTVSSVVAVYFVGEVHDALVVCKREAVIYVSQVRLHRRCDI